MPNLGLGPELQALILKALDNPNGGNIQSQLAQTLPTNFANATGIAEANALANPGSIPPPVNRQLIDKTPQSNLRTNVTPVSDTLKYYWNLLQNNAAQIPLPDIDAAIPQEIPAALQQSPTEAGHKLGQFLSDLPKPAPSALDLAQDLGNRGGLQGVAKTIGTGIGTNVIDPVSDIVNFILKGNTGIPQQNIPGADPASQVAQTPTATRQTNPIAAALGSSQPANTGKIGTPQVTGLQGPPVLPPKLINPSIVPTNTPEQMLLSMLSNIDPNESISTNLLLAGIGGLQKSVSHGEAVKQYKKQEAQLEQQWKVMSQIAATEQDQRALDNSLTQAKLELQADIANAQITATTANRDAKATQQEKIVNALTQQAQANPVQLFDKLADIDAQILNEALSSLGFTEISPGYGIDKIPPQEKQAVMRLLETKFPGFASKTVGPAIGLEAQIRASGKRPIE
jgi:hypothetical protein